MRPARAGRVSQEACHRDAGRGGGAAMIQVQVLRPSRVEPTRARRRAAGYLPPGPGPARGASEAATLVRLTQLTAGHGAGAPKPVRRAREIGLHSGWQHRRWAAWPGLGELQ